MGHRERRLAALERNEWDRVHALPPQEWFARGYIRVDRLPEPERTEFERLLGRCFDAAGDIAPEQLTTTERRRAVDLFGMIAERIPS